MESLINYIDKGDWQKLLFLILAIIVLSLIVKVIASAVALSLKKRQTQENNILSTFIDAVLRSLVLFTIAITFQVGIHYFNFSESVLETLLVVTKVLFAFAIGYFSYNLVDIPMAGYAQIINKAESDMGKMLIPALRSTLRIVIVGLVIIQLIQIFTDKPLTSIIAGLGIGGLAIALAAQDTIKHFIGSFVLAGDKPFKVGDRIVVDGHDGPIESVGMRSSRIRTLEGHLVSIPNGELANRTIQNIGKREYIRQLTDITITYETKPEMVKRAVDIIKELLNNHEGMREDFPPRVHFNAFNSDSLNIRFLYWYFPPNYWDFIAFNENLNMQILETFNKEGIEFAYPTQKIFLAGEAAIKNS